MASRKASTPIPFGKIQALVGGNLVGPKDGTVTGLSSLEEAGPGDLAYLASDRFLKAAQHSQCGFLLVGRPIEEIRCTQLVVGNPAYAFVRVATEFFSDPHRPRGIDPHISRGHHVEIGADPSIWPFVTLGDRVRIGARVTLFPGVFIGHDSVIGDDSILYPNVVIRDGCTIGSRVIIHSGTVVGSDGFGYVQHQGQHHKIPQLGGVILEDDVELGANVAVDRATFGSTVIKRGTKIDNLTQIAHNVVVGEHNILVAQVGIAGSTRLGRHVMVGGQAGLADHLTIGDHVMIAAKAGVTRNLESSQIVSGAPVMPHEVFLKAQAVIPKLPELRTKVRELEDRLKTLEGKPRKSRAKPKKTSSRTA